jgi:hypothetical protein
MVRSQALALLMLTAALILTVVLLLLLGSGTDDDPPPPTWPPGPVMPEDLEPLVIERRPWAARLDARDITRLRDEKRMPEPIDIVSDDLYPHPECCDDPDCAECGPMPEDLDR